MKIGPRWSHFLFVNELSTNKRGRNGKIFWANKPSLLFSSSATWNHTLLQFQSKMWTFFKSLYFLNEKIVWSCLARFMILSVNIFLSLNVNFIQKAQISTHLLTKIAQYEIANFRVLISIYNPPNHKWQIESKNPKSK